MVSKLLYIGLIGLFCVSYNQQITETTPEKLILFTSSELQVITVDEIQSIEALAHEMQLEFVRLEDSNGLPPEITTLPAIYYQNEQGRSQYYGRYTNYSRIKNFVRTSKMFHRGGASSIKKDILVWENEKASIYAPIKLTALSGVEPMHFDSALFLKETHEAIASGMQRFELRDRDEQAAEARSFYFNIYPYLDEWDNLSVTYELFSQYNCVKPISRKMEPIIPPFQWSQRDNGFNEIGQLIEEDILRQIERSTLGDAFVAVPETIKVSSWEEMGLEISTANRVQGHKDLAKNALQTKKWKVEQDPLNEDPIIIFSFLSPVDNYAGEVTRLEGGLSLDENFSFQNAEGKFIADISDVTMGAEDFDDSVQNKMLKRSLFPSASFEFEKVSGGDKPLVYGSAQDLEVLGKFSMMGISIPVNVATRVEPIQTEGINKLSVNCSFSLPLFEKFSVKGPDGPSPAKDILQFYLQFNLIENK